MSYKKCEICGKPVQVCGNFNQQRTALCRNAKCKRQRKTELQRARRENNERVGHDGKKQGRLV